MDDEDRSREVRSVLLKALGVVVVIGLVIALGTMIAVRALGLNTDESPGSAGAAPSNALTPLPTTALPVPGESSADPSASPSATPPEKKKGKKGGIELSITPVRLQPGQRVNLAGTYRSGDNTSLRVQRFEDGSWRDFADVTATVRAGTFATYVSTSRTGEQRFRVYDPQADKGSNAVRVTIG